MVQLAVAGTGPHTVAFAIRGPIARDDLPGLCERVCALLAHGRPDVVVCCVRGVGPDAVTVDALARLQLAARRNDCRVRLRHASQELLELVDLMGLADVLPDHAVGNELSGRQPSTVRPTTQREDAMASNGARKLFVNLAVNDLDRSVEFFTKLGFSFDPRFTDENATCMIVGEDAYVMLLVQPFFEGFTKKELADPRTQTEAVLAFSAESREQVDELAETALAAGGSPANDPIDMGFMYARSFQDLDGHVWEPVWMDMSAVEG
jgi:predicted lactoylglutathione lyase/ABC-type transporter Mla MlaB component